MARPIVWALGTAASVAVGATQTGQQLAGLFGVAPTVRVEVVGDQGRTVTVGADLNGHFTVHPALDGRRIAMMVDTGASLVALSEEDARRVGIRIEPREFTRRIATANGTVSAAPVRIREMRIGDIAVHDVEALVVPQGRLGTSLLGMSFLRRLKGFEISQGRLILRG